MLRNNYDNFSIAPKPGLCPVRKLYLNQNYFFGEYVYLGSQREMRYKMNINEMIELRREKSELFWCWCPESKPKVKEGRLWGQWRHSPRRFQFRTVNQFILTHYVAGFFCEKQGKLCFRSIELTAEYFQHIFLVEKLPTLLRCWLGTWCVPCVLVKPLRVHCRA